MALVSYADLVGTLADYLERADLDDRIPTFVRLAEIRLARRLNLADNESMTRLDLVAGRAPLPDDYAAWRSVNSAPRWSLDYVPPHAFIGLYGGSYGLSASGQGDGYDDVADGIAPYQGGGRPRVFTILGTVTLDDVDADVSIWPNGLNNLFILVGPAATISITLIYRQGLPPLTPSAPTNWLLNRAPDLYLYAALLEAQPFLGMDARIATWRMMMEAGIEDLRVIDRDARWGRARIQTSGPTP